MVAIRQLAMAMVVLCAGAAEAQDDPYLNLLGMAEVATGHIGQGVVGTTINIMTRKYRIEIWATNNREGCALSIFEVEEVVDDDLSHFLYDENRLATYRDPECSGELNQFGLSGRTASFPSFEPFGAALMAFGGEPFDAMGATTVAMDSSFSLRDRLPRTFLDGTADNRMVETYRLNIATDQTDQTGTFQLIFDSAESVCIHYLRLGQVQPLFTDNIIMLPPPRASRILEVQDDNCDGIYDHAFLEFSQLELGLGGYMINGRWVAQAARTMSVALATMDWTDLLISELLDAQ